ncbi:HET-domain-containing protein [Paraphaeosphaeria sporulosa]|uniref:HET-domain-containing protein n=1 Tax=Paraphaeosphaeria sporulosa TaxID=1460663 RepID=A0A177CGR8_9PLEO|nr:HET-domain-containing protein [Paraphaeosphaeria sporulosa]OAG05897.1 HET-domain-containing protein [Paraphaeosphaeria sporulosa]
MARRWMHTCTTSHDHCAARKSRLSNLGTSQCPTRLLDLQKAHSTRRIQVVHTKTEAIKSPYVTLSHCWGANPPIKLTNANIEQFSRGIEIKKLPRTFRDAIEVCGWYGFRYLWIDSLCIIQDSEADWKKESTAMKSTYSQGALNIAASTAADSSYGLFARRSPYLLAPLVLNVPGYGTCILQKSMEELSKSITQGPLASRAWVLQEWVLSPRVLHFGQQLFWECSETLLSESLPLGFTGHDLLSEPSYFILKRVISFIHGREHLSVDKAGEYQTWRYICEEYSRRQLTVSSDKMVALSGVADLFQSSLNDTCMAGLWRTTIVSDMCWRCWSEAVIWITPISRKRRYPWESTRPRDYGAPSWSWMSVHNEIEYPWRRLLHQIAAPRWPNRSTSHERPRPTECNSITLFGVLRPATWSLLGKDKLGETQFRIFLDGIKAFDATARVAWGYFIQSGVASIRVDDLVGQSFPVEEIYFLPLLASTTHGNTPAIAGIILCQADGVRFRRVAYFELYEPGILGRLFFGLKYPATILNDPWNYFQAYAKKNKTAADLEFFQKLFQGESQDFLSIHDMDEFWAWQVKEVQKALGPYNGSMFQPLEAQEIEIV